MKKYKAAGKLEGKTALITGGDSGIGRAVAIGFAKEGADVAIVYLEETEDALATHRFVEAEERNCLLLRGNVGRPDFCRKSVERTVKEFGRLDILVNNAAEQHLRYRLEDMTGIASQRGQNCERVERTGRWPSTGKKDVTRSSTGLPERSIEMGEHKFLKHLREDHAEQKKLGKKLTEARGSQERSQLLKQFKESLYPHMVGEEVSIFQRIAQAADEEVRDHGLEGLQEHHVAKIVLREIMDLDPESKIFKAKSKILDELNKHHIEEEEGKIFQHLQKLCDDRELDKLFEQYKKGEEGAKS